MTLSSSSISGGAFGGATSGGSGGGYTASAGSYEGLFTGAEGDEVVGSVIIPLSGGYSGPGIEAGIFVAEEVQ